MKFNKITFSTAVVLGCLFNYFFYGKPPGISFPLFTGFVLGSVFALARIKDRRLSGSQILIAFASFLFSFFFFYRAAVELMWLNALVTIHLILLLFVPWFRNRAIEQFGISDYLFGSATVLGRSMIEGPKEMDHCTKRLEPNHDILRRILMGVGLAIFPLLIFVSLMTSADLLFEKFLGDVWSFVIEYVLRYLSQGSVIFFITILFAGLFHWLRSNEDDAPIQNQPLPSSASADPFQPWGFVETNVMIGCVNLVFLVFTFIQILFLFSGEQRIEALGVTYSAYARQGFWQMIWIALIALALSVMWDEKSIRTMPKEKWVHKTNLCLLSAMTGITMISAFYRLFLYEEAYGFTVLRFYSHTFTLLVGGVFIILILKIIFEQSVHIFLFRAFSVSLIFLLGWNLVNPHRFIAHVNLRRCILYGEKLDGRYLNSLSVDAVPAYLSALGMTSEQNINDNLTNQLNCWEINLQEKLKSQPWPSFHWAEGKALKAIKCKNKIIGKIRPC